MTATQPEGLDMTDEQIRKSMTSEQIQLERKLTCEAIDGAIAFGYQDTNAPPSDEHWLAPFWKIGRKQAELELLSASKPVATEGWRLVPVEPTPEMILKGGIITLGMPLNERSVKCIYAAMLSVSPDAVAPAQSGESVAKFELTDSEIQACSMEPAILRLLANTHEDIASDAETLDNEVRASYHVTRASELNAKADAEEREMKDRGDYTAPQSSRPAATPYRWPESEHIIGSGNGIRDIARHIHWPECWDMAAYPSLAHAVHEMILSAAFRCGNDDCKHAAPQLSQPVEAGERAARHVNDGTPPDAKCEAALAQLDAKASQGIDPFWAWGFRTGWHKANAAMVGELDPLDALRYTACRESAIERGLFATPEEYDAMVDDSLQKKGKEVLTGRGNNYGKKVAKDGSLYRVSPSAVVLDDERAALKSIIDAGRNAKPLHEGGIGENTVYLTPDMYMALSQAPSLAFESALAELVNKIDTGLDSGDLLVDARRALSAIDSILSGGDLVACAHEYFRDSGDRYEKSIEFRIGWDACLDAIVQARAASPQATAMQPAQTERALTDERWKIDAAYAKGYSAGWSNGPYGCAAPLKTTSQKDQAMTREQRNVIAEVATALEMQAEHERNLGIYEGEAMFDDLAKRLNGILTAAQPASDRSAHD